MRALTPGIERRPSPSRGQYHQLIALLVLVGLFAGYLAHTVLFGRQWLAASVVCKSEVRRRFPSVTTQDDVLAEGKWMIECIAPAQHRSAIAMVIGGAVVLLAGLTLMYALPRWELRRLGGAQPAPDFMTKALASVSEAAGLGERPTLLLAPAKLREPFTVRIAGRPAIVLPKGSKRLAGPALDAIVRHELGHVIAGDVRLVWLTRGLRYVLPVALAVPVALLLTQSASAADLAVALSDPMWADYAVRCAMFLSLASLLALKVRRAREHEADLAAASLGSGRELSALLYRMAAPPYSIWRAARATHPNPTRRIAIIRRPTLIARLDWLDDAAAGVLAGMAVAPLFSLAALGFIDTFLAHYSALFIGTVIGLLLAGTWGIAVWRRTALQPKASYWQLVAGPTVALTIGLPIGLMSGVWNTGTGRPPLGGLLGVTTFVLVLTAAAYCSALLARCWATPTTKTIVPFAVGAALFGFAAYAALSIILINESFLRFRAGIWLLTPHWPALAALGILCAVAWHRRASSVAVVLLGAAAAGICATAVRLTVPTPAEIGRVDVALGLDQWAALAAGLGVALSLVVVDGFRGFGDAMWAAPVTAVTTALAMWACSWPHWMHPLAAATHNRACRRVRVSHCVGSIWSRCGRHPMAVV